MAELQEALAELAKANEALQAEIAERRRAHEDVRADEARHRAIVEDQTELICRFLPDTTLTFVNGAYCRAFGSTPEELIGRRFLPLIPEAEHARVRALIESLNAEHPHAAHEHPVLAPDGTRRWQQWTNRAICDEQGRVVEYQAVGRDVTERKRAEAELAYRLELERLVTGISSGFIHLPPEEVDGEIGSALERIGAFAEADRSYVFQFSDDLARASCTHEWCGEGIAPAIDELQDLPIDRFPWALGRQRRAEIVHVPRVRDLPAEAGALRAELAREGVQSVLSVPMVCGGTVRGFVGLDAVRDERVWSPDMVSVLRIVGEIIASALERRRAVQALRESEERFRQMAENIREVFWLAEAGTGKVLYASPAFEEIWGRSCQAVCGSPSAWLESVHPEDRDRVAAEAATQASGRATDQEYRVVRPDGSVRWIRDRAFPIRDENGALCRVAGIAEDMTERKRAEEALRRSEQRLRTTRDAMADAIHVADRGLRIVLFNTAFRDWCRELGLGTDFVGRSVIEVFPFLPDSVRDEYAQVFEAGEPLITVETTSVGERRIVTETRKIPVFEGDRVARAITIVRDITQQRRAEEELQRAERLRSLSLLAGGIAHDFNNMLMGIMASISLARLDRGAGRDTVALLAEAEESVLRAKGLAQQLLTFSRGGAPVLRAASVGELLRPTARFALAGSNVRCQFALPDGLWAAEMDVGQIGQVVQNLVINAQQALPGGGVVGISAQNVTLEPDELPPLPRGRYVKIAVADRGVGIPAEHLPQVFDPYFTTKGAGNGLGLAVCHSIVAKHKGHIRVDSEPGVGTTFEVFLPASQRAVPPTRKKRRAVAARRGRLLLMDDDDLVRRGAGRMLEVIGYEVESVEEGAQAVEAYRRAAEAGRAFDVVVLDLTVPGGMGGLECIAKLLEIDPGVLAIVSSGYSEDPIMAQFRDHGFHGVVPKPYTMEELSDALRRALGEPDEQA